MTILAFALTALDTIPALIGAGMDVVAFVTKTSDDLKKMQAEDRDPTDAEWDALNKVIENLRAQRPDVSDE